MGLFQDDFYSTKVSRRGLRGWNRGSNSGGWSGRGWGGGFGQGSGGRRVLGVTAVAAAVIVLLFAGYWLRGAYQGSGVVAADSSDNVVRAAEKVGPAVVSVVSTLSDSTDKVQGMGIGSGVIFQKSGGKARLVTNNHVVEGGKSLEVVLANGKRTKAEIVGRDLMTDLAVLEIDDAGVKQVADFGVSGKLKPGEPVIAIGNPLGLDLSQTITKGIVSSPKRTIPVNLGPDGGFEWELDVIQTDAAINQGNSGGALVTLDGKVIGINSMKISQSGVEGLGFAIPIDEVKPIIEQLIRDHKVKRPYLGVVSENLEAYANGRDVLKLPDSVQNGVIVIEVTGPAKEAGIKTSDVIVRLDHQDIVSTIDLRKYLYNHKKIGDKIDVTYYRSGKKANVTLTLEELTEK